jgi:hypothetical protein
MQQQTSIGADPIGDELTEDTSKEARVDECMLGDNDAGDCTDSLACGG